MRSILVAFFVAILTAPVQAADPKAIEAAIANGAAYLDDQYKALKPDAAQAGDGIGPTALAGLALLECGKKPTDPSLKAIHAAVREAAYTETRTYQLSLCLLFFDRFGDSNDNSRIQMLAVRLLAGQNANGGWTYDCVDDIPKAEEQRLRARIGTNQLVANGKEPAMGKTPPAKEIGIHGVSGRLHPEVERHQKGLLVNNARGRINLPDDNSNTQFGLLAIWVAHKHGVHVEASMELIEKRFLASQTQSGGWPYSGLIAVDGSPSMTCAGLLGLATAVGRREERRLKAEIPRRPEPPKPVKTKQDADPLDPFFSPVPPMPEVKAPPVPKKPPVLKKPVADPRDKAIDAALQQLAAVLGGEDVARGRNPFQGGRLGHNEMYFLWSLERVGVVYGLEKIGKHNWYQYGVNILIPSQNRDGSWGNRDVETSFALLFLGRSNLIRDLSASVQRDPRNSELRGGPAPPPETSGSAATPKPEPMRKPDPVASLPKPTPTAPPPIIEPAKPKPALPASDESAKLAEVLLKVPAALWPKALEQVRDGKGSDFTKALVHAIHQTDGDRKKQVRDALAERLTHMSAATLRILLKEEELEVRRAAVLACAMKDEKAHVPDLIDRLMDDEEIVVRAARAGLKSLSGGQDFGPEAGSTKTDRTLAAAEWKAWWSNQKK